MSRSEPGPADPRDEASQSDFLAVDAEDGRVLSLVLLGVVGIVSTVIAIDGWMILLVLGLGLPALGLVVWRASGHHHLWLEDDTVVSDKPSRRMRVPLADLVEVEASFVPKAGDHLHLRARSGEITLTSLGEGTEAFRHELGRRLRQSNSLALRHASLKTLKYLGLT